jgi:hypothetical protein
VPVVKPVKLHEQNTNIKLKYNTKSNINNNKDNNNNNNNNNNNFNLGECFISFGAESFVFQFAIQKYKE